MINEAFWAFISDLFVFVKDKSSFFWGLNN